MDKNRKKQGRKYIAWGCGAVVVLLLAVMPMIASAKESAEGPEASILSADVERRDIDTQIIGGGQLSSEASVTVKIPQNVKLTEYLVDNGAIVSEGDPIAAVDRVSVMTAITEVQDTLDYLAQEIAQAGNEKASDTVTALAGGTVKRIYALPGESVQDVMLDHGALALLSLDGLMAVDLEVGTELGVGDRVCVTLSDGTTADGTVRSNLEGILTVTVADKGYSLEEAVTVATEDGRLLGSGELYIYSQWNATAYSGTVSDILVKEGNAVSVGQTLIRLEDTGYAARYQQLIDQRREYEELMGELFRMYRTKTVTAPCDGIVAGVDQNGAYLLSGDGGSWFISLLAGFSQEKDHGYTAYTAFVKAVSANGMELMTDESACQISDLEGLSSVSPELSRMTRPWSYTGDTTVYLQGENGLMYPAGNAKEGDILLAVGDEEKVCWFVLLKGQTGTAQPVSGSAEGAWTVLLSSGTDIPEMEDEPEADPENGSVYIVTTSLNQGTVGKDYLSALQASDGTGLVSGTWSASGLPSGLVLNPETGVISGVPASAGSYPVTISVSYGEAAGDTKEFILTVAEADPQTVTCRGYVAQVLEIGEGVLKVKQTAYSYPITDLDNLPAVSADSSAMTEETVYFSPLIKADSASVDDILLVVVGEDGELKLFVRQNAAPGEEMPGGGPGAGGSGQSGGFPSGSSGGAVKIFEPYTLEKIAVASVTSQEHMAVTITVDEQDISRLYGGQAAMITVDALGGEQFDASVTQIAVTGENSGGSSKFTVELTLEKSGEMLPGMTASAFITVDTASNVPCVPVAALDQDGTKTIVYTSCDETGSTLGTPVAVTTGASDGEYVQIVEGLSEGQTCYYAYYDTLAESNAPKQSGISFRLPKRW